MNQDIVSRFSGIGRSLDFECVSNRIIVYLSLGCLFSGAGIQWLQGRGAAAALLWGLRAAAAVFLAWAFARELDPARHGPAAAAAGLSLAAVWLWGLPELGLLFWLLIGIRILNRTTGLKPKLFDLVFYAGMGVWLAYKGHWESCLLTIMVLLLNGHWDKDKKNYFVAAAAFAGIPVILLLDGTQWSIRVFDGTAVGAAAIGAAIFAPVIIRSGKIQISGDSRDYKLKPIRVQSAQIFAAGFWLLDTVLGGSRGLLSLFPVYAAGLGSGLYWLYSLVKKPIMKSGQE